MGNERHVDTRFGGGGEKPLRWSHQKRQFRGSPSTWRRDARLSVNDSTNKPREWRLALDVSHRWRGGGEGVLFFFFCCYIFLFPTALLSTLHKQKRAMARRDAMVASGTESGTATGVQGPDVSIRNYLFFFSFFPNESFVCSVMYAS